MLKVWGRVSSVNVQKVMWAAAELHLAVDRTDAGMEFGVVDTPAYRRMNPNGLVPTIQDGDLVLWESNAIVRYLYARYGTAQTAEERAVADKWMDWTTSRIQPPLRTLFWGYVRTPPERREATALEEARAQAASVLTIADDALASQPYLAGGELTMGDIPLGCFVNRWFQLPIERPGLPRVAAWYERLKARPAYRHHVMVPLS